MAYREVDMWEILNVLQRIGRGESKSAVARVTGYRRKTIGPYVATAVKLGWRPRGQEPTEELAAEVFVDSGPGQSLAVPERRSACCCRTGSESRRG